jgi:tRNA-dihydrouridine synthase A
MKAAVNVPVTVKCRIGIDEQDPEESLDTLTRNAVAAGADALIVHARKAWLDGLSPRENRDIPPLDYDRVYRLKRAWPKLHISINGGIGSVERGAEHLVHADGVMMGRAAYQEPWRLLQVDPLIYGAPAPFESSKAAIEAFIPYVDRELAQGTRLHAMTRHVLGLFQGVPGARAFRRHIATHAVKPEAGAEVLRDAAALVTDVRAEPTPVAA